MTSARSAEASRDRFNDLVASGAYGAGFTHPKPARDFVGVVVRKLLDEIEPRDRALSVLDAGCGNGAWLQVLHGLAASRGDTQPRLYGFDVADRMVETADQHLSALNAPVLLQRGDILDPESYRFPDGQDRFDLVFAYDVVQQVTPGHQFDAVAQLANAVKPGGRAVVFDHERWSRYGLRMAYRKFVTAKFGIPLVPRYFCAASYPPLNRLAQRISAASNVTAHVVVDGHPRKRALVLRRIPETS
jgi:SAM-dependent methyltransferase